jgi:uncharacterized iron-regulated membrane protein
VQESDTGVFTGITTAGHAMNPTTFRTLHRWIALITLPFLAVSAITGLVYRIGRSWFGMSNDTGGVVRSIHEGAYLGETIGPVYVLFTGGALLTLAVSGATMWRRRDLFGTSAGDGQAGKAERRPPRRTVRWFHRIVSMALVLLLATTAATGLAYRLSQAWLGWPKERAQWLMDIHQGTLIFGKDHRVYYVLVVGLGLLFMLATGAKLIRWSRGRSTR